MKTIADVAENHLCCGCGACSYLDPSQVKMVDDLEQGRRPMVVENAELTEAHKQAFQSCPGQKLTRDPDPKKEFNKELYGSWGPILEVWEGHASDAQIRFAGSSGGAATALAVFALEQKEFAGVLHIAARKDRPIFNETVLSTNRDQLLERTGSRYAPASPCDKLQWIEEAEAPCVFIGKPCDVAATYQARKVRPNLDRNLGLTIGIFCAGTPSSSGTIATLSAMGIDDPNTVTSVRYRGKGWPGMFSVEFKGANGPEVRELTYDESWGNHLQKHRQWRCYVCPDHTGEFADIAVGDPWHKPPNGDTPGRSLVLVRTERGRAFLQDAISAGVVQLEKVDPQVIEQAQPNLRNVRKLLWARIATLRMMGAASPRFPGFKLFADWFANTSVSAKIRSIGSTVKRVIKKRLNRSRPVTPSEP